MSRAARGWTGGCIAAVLLLVAGVLLVVALGRSVAGAAPFGPSPQDYPGRAQGLVLDVNPAQSYDGRGVDVEFSAGGLVKVADIEIDHGALPPRGDHIAIAYDTEDPDDAVLVSQLVTGDLSGATHDAGNAALAFGGLGCLLAAIVAGVVTIVWARRGPSRAPAPAPSYGYGYGYGLPYGWVPPATTEPPPPRPPEPPEPGPDGPASPWGGPG